MEPKGSPGFFFMVTVRAESGSALRLFPKAVRGGKVQVGYVRR